MSKDFKKTDLGRAMKKRLLQDEGGAAAVTVGGHWRALPFHSRAA